MMVSCLLSWSTSVKYRLLGASIPHLMFMALASPGE